MTTNNSNRKWLPDGRFEPILGKFKSVTERDESLYKDYKNNQRLGIPMVWMVNKYQMSTQNIYQIIKRLDKRSK